MINPETPKTIACFRDGMWHADELANLCAKLEHSCSLLEQENKRLKIEVEKAFEEGFLKSQFSDLRFIESWEKSEACKVAKS